MTRADSVLRHHRTQVHLDPDVPALAVESAAIAEVVYMLIDNATKYSPSNTLIRIEGHREDDHQVRVVVVDEGPGIPEDLRERVFEKFFRVPGRESFDTRRSGVGLGLPIARRLVESQAGRIWIEESSNGGTSVVLTLPVGTGANTTELVDAPVAVRT